MTGQKKIHFHLKMVFRNEILPEVYCADLILDIYETNKIEVRLFMQMNAKTNAIVDSLKNDSLESHIELLNVESERYYDLDFSKSDIVGITLSSRLNYVQLFIKEVSYKWKKYEKELVKGHSYFLTDSAKSLSKVIFSKFDGKGSWYDKTKRKSNKFLDLKYQITNEFYKTGGFSNTSDELTLRKVPIINLINNLHDEYEIGLRIESICILLSFYLCDEIEWYMSVYNYEEYQKITIKDIERIRLKIKSSSFTTDFNSSQEFIKSVLRKEQLIDNFDFWEKTIEKFILSSRLDGESKFMILYNILEQSFVYLKTTGKVVVKYDKPLYKGLEFKKKEINELCRNLIEDIKKIIPRKATKERAEFDKQNLSIKFKESIIVKKRKDTSNSKIQLLLKKLVVKPEHYGIMNLREIINIRDEIIHPSVDKGIDSDNLKDINTKLFKLVNVVI